LRGIRALYFGVRKGLKIDDTGDRDYSDAVLLTAERRKNAAHSVCRGYRMNKPKPTPGERKIV
jgi:hypothetical protein